METKLKVMSFNIRCDTLMTRAGDADYWPERRPLVTQMIQESTPHILGVQELMEHQVLSIERGLKRSYVHVGKPRDKAPGSEQNAIFYDPDFLLLLDKGTFWLSDTPLVSGSITWDNQNTRIVTWAHFYHKETHRSFTVANTHFDHVSEYSRVKSAEMILNHFGGNNETIILGDFNANPDNSKAFEILSPQFNDALSIGEPIGPLYGTWNNYKPPVIDGERLDWILTSKDLAVETVCVNTFNVAGRYPSDHLPVQAVLTLP